MSVEDEKGNLLNKNYVVKIFKNSHREATCRELFANLLAQEFDLDVPNAALVEVDFDMLSLMKVEGNIDTSLYNPGYYFASEYLSDTRIVTKAELPVPVEWELQLRIFAFDVLIRNSDRRIGKPNFLLQSGNPVLIDHELSLNFSKGFLAHDIESEWNFIRSGNERNHVFLVSLQTCIAKNGLDVAGFLSDYLRTLNPNKLYAAATLLQEYGYNDEAAIVESIVGYLSEIRSNIDRFLQLVNLLLHDA